MRPLIGLLVGAVALLALTGAETYDASDEFVPENGVVLQVAEKTGVAQACAATAGVPFDGVWSPTENQIAHLESRLADRLAEERANGGPASGLRPSEYYRQYCPVVGSGRRLIVVAGFHKTLLAASPQWRSEFIAPGRPGAKQFWVTYEPERDRFENLTFGGAG